MLRKVTSGLRPKKKLYFGGIIKQNFLLSGFLIQISLSSICVYGLAQTKKKMLCKLLYKFLSKKADVN